MAHPAKEKDFRKIFSAAEKSGWKIYVTGNGHYQLHSPNGSILRVFPGASREVRKTISRLKKEGVSL